MVFRKILEIQDPSCITIPRKSKTYSNTKVVKADQLLVSADILGKTMTISADYYLKNAVDTKCCYL